MTTIYNSKFHSSRRFEALADGENAEPEHLVPAVRTRSRRWTTRLAVALVAGLGSWWVPPLAVTAAPSDEGTAARPEADATAPSPEAPIGTTPEAPIPVQGLEDEAALEAAFEFARAKILAESGSLAQALELYQRALEGDDDDPYALLEVARFHVYLAQISRSEEKQIEHLEAAAEYARQARDLAPENLDALRSYAQVQLRLVEQNRFEAIGEATEAFERIRQEKPDDLQVLLSLGQLYLWQRQAVQATAVLQEAADLEPGQRMIQVMLVEALLGTEDKAAAEKALLDLLEIDPSAGEHRLRLVELLSERGEHRAAVQALRANPEGVRTRRYRQVLARELHLSGDNEEALGITQELLEKSPTNEGLRRLRVAILSAMARYSEAIDELQQLSHADESSANAEQDRLLLSRFLERIGDADQAAKVLRELAVGETDTGRRLQLQMALVGLLERQGRADEAIALLGEQWQQTLAQEKPQGAIALGRIFSELLVRSGDFERAYEVLDQTRESLRDVAPAAAIDRLSFQRLVVLAKEEAWTAIVAEGRALLESTSEEIRVGSRLLLADALASSEQLDQALEVLAAGGQSPQLEAKRLEILFEHEKGAVAEKEIETKVASGDLNQLYFAAQVFQRADRHGDSIPLLQKLLLENTDSVPALFLLGAAYERISQREEAVATFRKLLEVQPDHAPSLNYLGYMFAERGENLEEALRMVQRAVAIDPDNGAYVDSLGWVYFQTGRYDEARLHLEWAARLVPEDPTIHEHLGDLYLRLEELEQARSSYQQSLALGGDGVDEVRRKLEALEEEKGL